MDKLKDLVLEPNNDQSGNDVSRATITTMNREGLIPRQKPDDDTLASQEASTTLEKRASLKLSDLVVGTVTLRQAGGLEEYRILDSENLERALVDGSISEEEVNRTLKLNWSRTLAEQITDNEAKQSKSTTPNVFEQTIRQLKAMRSARQHYIPAQDNMSFIVYTSDKEKLAQRTVGWLREQKAQVVSFQDGSEITDERKILNDVILASNLERGAHVNITLDYPTLTHGVRMDPIKNGKARRGYEFKGNNEFRQRFYFYHHADPIEGKTNCPADLLSALRVVNRFKREGFDIFLGLDETPETIKEGEKEIHYIVK